MASIEPEMLMLMPLTLLLPEDVLMLILSCLPVKTLIRFKSVSKYWYSLIYNPSFISLQPQPRPAQPNDCLIATTQIVSDGPRHDDGTVLPDGNHHHHDAEFSMYLVPYETASPIQDLDLFFSGLYVGGGNVTGVFFLGCHNGIMCLANDVTSTVVIINPATREFRILSQPLYESKHNSFLAFTFYPKADDYKVIRFCTFYEFTPFVGFYDYYDPYNETWFNYENYRGHQKVQIYDLSTDSWRETNAVVPKYFPYCDEPNRCTSLSDGVIY